LIYYSVKINGIVQEVILQQLNWGIMKDYMHEMANIPMFFQKYREMWHNNKGDALFVY
jgi:hypothetical protein